MFEDLDIDHWNLIIQLKMLHKEIRDARARELDVAISTIVEIMLDLGITIDEVARVLPLHRPCRRNSGTGKRAARYMNPETGQTWSGRGRRPEWLRNKRPEDFLLPAQSNDISKKTP
ncbi:H-NS histone family protein [Burkholderia gladioli]|uniref:H-NS histone family protein n=1 Tax=Burkholderia gladioli TaxID=28095 RepID=UPI00163F5FB4|nr:H-NS histone family protein [Burkholderia gladioli]